MVEQKCNGTRHAMASGGCRYRYRLYPCGLGLVSQVLGLVYIFCQEWRAPFAINKNVERDT